MLASRNVKGFQWRTERSDAYRTNNACSGFKIARMFNMGSCSYSDSTHPPLEFQIFPMRSYARFDADWVPFTRDDQVSKSSVKRDSFCVASASPIATPSTIPTGSSGTPLTNPVKTGLFNSIVLRDHRLHSNPGRVRLITSPKYMPTSTPRDVVTASRVHPPAMPSTTSTAPVGISRASASRWAALSSGRSRRVRT